MTHMTKSYMHATETGNTGSFVADYVQGAEKNQCMERKLPLKFVLTPKSLSAASAR